MLSVKEVSLHKVPLKAVTLHGKFLAVFIHARCIHPAVSSPAVVSFLQIYEDSWIACKDQRWIRTKSKPISVRLKLQGLGTFNGKSMELIDQRLLKITFSCFSLQALRRQQQKVHTWSESNQAWALSLCGGLGGKSVKSCHQAGQIWDWF